MALVTTQDMLNQLHLDASESAQIESLITFAQDYIVNTTDKGATVQQIIAETNESIFNQTVRAIVESLYFGNAEVVGFGTRSLVMLNALRNMYAGA